MGNLKPLSVYIHIPFCVKKCLYCDFLSYPASETEKESYIKLLLSEIEKQSSFYNSHKVISVFIGGGTPSVLDGRVIEKVLCKLKDCFQVENEAEITIEVNPGTVTEEKLASYLRAGINRLSIGLQTADDGQLRTLGRIHDYRDFCTAYEMARRFGFKNINVDLMSAIPAQTLDSYCDTLKKVLEYEPEHISAYSLILEEGTWFYEHQDELELPTEEEDRRLYELTGQLLLAHGYHRYEISNYAKDGYECAHNKVYWQRGDYAGFGLGAASMVEEVRWSNRRMVGEYETVLRQLPQRGYSGHQKPSVWQVRHSGHQKPSAWQVRHSGHQKPVAWQARHSGHQKPSAWQVRHSGHQKPSAWQVRHSEIQQPELPYLRSRFGENINYLTKEEQMEEFMFLGLRLLEGVKKTDFRQKFGLSIEEVYGRVIDKLQKEGLLIVEDSIRLTLYGIDVSNYVMAQFLF